MIKPSFFISAVLALGACTSNPGGLYAPPADTVYGAAGCNELSLNHCAMLSGNTILGFGPVRYEYLALDGSAYRWIGDRIIPGRWYYGGGTQLCTIFHEDRPADCRSRRQLVGEVDGILVGDPFDLATRTSAPADLGFFGSQTEDELLRLVGRDPASVDSLNHREL